MAAKPVALVGVVYASMVAVDGVPMAEITAMIVAIGYTIGKLAPLLRRRSKCPDCGKRHKNEEPPDHG